MINIQLLYKPCEYIRKKLIVALVAFSFGASPVAASCSCKNFMKPRLVRIIEQVVVIGEYMYIQYQSEVLKVSIRFKHHKRQYVLSIKSINTFQISMLFNYQYFLISNSFMYHYHSNISTFQASIRSKDQKYQYFTIIKNINIFQIPKVLILFKY